MNTWSERWGRGDNDVKGEAKEKTNEQQRQERGKERKERHNPEKANFNFQVVN